MKDHQTMKGYVFAFAAIAIWSGFILASRQGGISVLTPYDVIAIRYSTCALILFPFWVIYRPQLLDLKLIICSLAGALLYSVCVFTGFESTQASHSAVLLPGSIPILVTLLSMLLLKPSLNQIGSNQHHQNQRKWFGLSLITIGIVLLIGSELTDYPRDSLHLGHLWILASAFFWALYSVLIQKWDISPDKAIFSLGLTTFCLYMPIYLLMLPKSITLPIEAEILPEVLLQSVYQGVMASIVQMFLYVRAIQLIGAQNMGMLMAIVPILTSIIATYVFSESITTLFITALIFVSLGIVFSALNRPIVRSKQPVATSPEKGEAPCHS